MSYRVRSLPEGRVALGVVVALDQVVAGRVGQKIPRVNARSVPRTSLVEVVIVRLFTSVTFY